MSLPEIAATPPAGVCDLICLTASGVVGVQSPRSRGIEQAARMSLIGHQADIKLKGWNGRIWPQADLPSAVHAL